MSKYHKNLNTAVNPDNCDPKFSILGNSNLAKAVFVRFNQFIMTS